MDSAKYHYPKCFPVDFDHLDYVIYEIDRSEGVLIDESGVHSNAAVKSGSGARWHAGSHWSYASECGTMRDGPLGTDLETVELALDQFETTDPNKTYLVSSGIYHTVRSIMESSLQVVELTLTYQVNERKSMLYNRHLDRSHTVMKLHITITVTAVILIDKNKRVITKEALTREKGSVETTFIEIAEEICAQCSLSKDLKYVDPKCCELSLILPSGVGGIFIHEAIGHLHEADNFFSCNNVMRKNWFHKIADSSITIIDAPLDNQEISCDGNPIKSIPLVNKGVVEGVMSDAKTSDVFKIENSGNGRSNGFENVAIPRMRNTYLDRGSDSYESLIRSTKHGLLALDIGGGQTDSSSGAFMFNITHGLLIVNGEPVAQVGSTLFSGSTVDMLMRIDGLGNDLKYYNALCFKQGQAIDVSYGQPTLRFEQVAIGMQ